MPPEIRGAGRRPGRAATGEQGVVGTAQRARNAHLVHIDVLEQLPEEGGVLNYTNESFPPR